MAQYGDVDPEHARRLARAAHECRPEIAEIAREGYPSPLATTFPDITCRTLVLRRDADIDRTQVVAGQPVLAAEPADAAAERQPCDADVRVLSGLVVPLLAGFQHVATEFLPQPFDRAVRSCRA